jgi:hypothetical protein
MRIGSVSIGPMMTLVEGHASARDPGRQLRGKKHGRNVGGAMAGLHWMGSGKRQLGSSKRTGLRVMFASERKQLRNAGASNSYKISPPACA